METITEGITGIIERRKSSGFNGPLKHHQGTMTSARYDDLINWDVWCLRVDGEGGYYNGELSAMYEKLGIVSGNGEWYESAWRFDNMIDDDKKNRWEEFVVAELGKIDPADFWEWDEEGAE